MQREKTSINVCDMKFAKHYLKFVPPKIIILH